MILLLDNYDSFTYNLAQYLGELGCQVEVHRNDKITVEEIMRRKPERIVISPGPCTPQEAGISVELVERLAGKFTATRYHSLIVEKKSLPRELTITAETDDGIIMGLRHRRHKIEGVQFHPESVLTDSGKQLLKNFLSL